MSSRALRKAQREREEQERLHKLQAEEEEQEGSEDETQDGVSTDTKPSLFAMLNGVEEEQDDEDEETLAESEGVQGSTPVKRPPKAPTGKGKKKKKAKSGAKVAPSAPAGSDDSLDAIDKALKSLSAADHKPTNGVTDGSAVESATAEVHKLLSVDTQHLHAINEMRRLFGRAALEQDHDDQEAGAAGGRRRNRNQQMGLAGALAGRNMPGGRGHGLAALGLRRNIFIQGKEEWPASTGGGLGMEIVEKRTDGTVEYRFIHNTAYQDVQRQFEMCVASMDPNRLVQLLQLHPYHISTLLQVSEIAKQERDHTTSGDLLERALFAFGRAVHSTFSSNLSNGKARLDFRRPENREFWLAAWRYIGNLSMRATWRTVYEWAKLLLSLDPETDPYRVRLVLDQFALRARQPQQFLNLVKSSFFAERWKELPNIQLSQGLAEVQTGSRSKQPLFKAISRYPWVAARLFQELNLDNAPPGIWGKTPRTETEKLYTELYAVRAKDLWNTPETTNLLIEVSSAVSSALPTAPHDGSPIEPDEARHTLLSENPALIAHLPRALTANVGSSSDPLPPLDNIESYSSAPASRSRGAASSSPDNTARDRSELQTLYQFFASLFPWFNPAGRSEERPPMTEEEIERTIVESGVGEEVVVRRTQRMMELQEQLMGGIAYDELGGEGGQNRLREDDGDSD
ncbi:hypothetical protein LTR50_001166 [Elasticomyces elasticus]|nr:hypothetical protein LTR50_001166 [Elasticomyces elasticus]